MQHSAVEEKLLDANDGMNSYLPYGDQDGSNVTAQNIDEKIS